jgi:hypothetical protein
MTAISRAVATVALVSAGFAAGTLLTDRLQSRAPETPAATAPAETGAPQGSAASAPIGTATLPDFTQIAARTSPAVVNISAVQVYRQRRIDPFFGSFFGEDAYAMRRGQSAGSGVIIRADGYVLTNNHVLGQGASGRPSWSGSIRRPTSRCSRSRSATCRRWPGATPPPSRSPSGCSPSATPISSARPSRSAWSAG